MEAEQGYKAAFGASCESRSHRGGLQFGSTSVLVFLSVLAVIGALRLVALAVNGTDLYMDEAQYWAWSRELAAGYFSKPPLIAWIIHGSTAVCGHGEACVRLPAVLLHLVTALLIYALARRLYTQQIAFWAGLGYALLPSVSLSSGIISTDVPLLAFWALALVAFAGLMARPTFQDALLLAVALGLGLNAKYAMAYFFVCAAVYFVVAPEHRARLKAPHLWMALAGGLALIGPNISWNVTNGFVTFAHTADNAAWRGIPFHPDKAAEFLLAQFGVFGPILFGALLVIVWRAVRRPADVASADRLLLAFSIPILVIVTTQALISRAHANWAAPAYVAAVVLVTAVLIRDRAWTALRASTAIHAAVAVGLALATWQAGRLALPGIGDPFARTLGNREIVAAVRDELTHAERKGAPYAAVLTNSRELAAALAYYGRDLPVPALSWREGRTPRNYFEMTRPYAEPWPSPVLLVTPRDAGLIAERFEAVTSLGPRDIPAGRHATRPIHLTHLVSFRGD